MDYKEDIKSDKNGGKISMYVFETDLTEILDSMIRFRYMVLTPETI